MNKLEKEAYAIAREKIIQLKNDIIDNINTITSLRTSNNRLLEDLIARFNNNDCLRETSIALIEHNAQLCEKLTNLRKVLDKRDNEINTLNIMLANHNEAIELLRGQLHLAKGGTLNVDWLNKRFLTPM